MREDCYEIEVLEMDENEADRLFRLALKLVSYYGKFKFGDRQFRMNVEFLKLGGEKKTSFLQKMEANSQALHKRLSFVESDGMPYFKYLDWRYDVQVGEGTMGRLRRVRTRRKCGQGYS